MTLDHPGALLLAIPVLVSLVVFRARSLVQALRVALCALVILALASPALLLPSRAGTVIVVADRSASMPKESEATEREVIARLAKTRPKDARLGVVAFGREAAVETMPGGEPFTSFAAEVGRDGSDLHTALEKALALVPRGAPGRILVVSDGRFTGRDPAAAAFQAAARGVAVDFRELARPTANDLAIDRVEAPDTVAPGEAFFLNAWIRSGADEEVAYALEKAGRTLASGRTRVAAGLTRLTFRDRAEGPGTAAYRLRVGGEASDPVPENNEARLLVGIRGRKPLLHVGSPGSALVRLLEKGHVDVVSGELDGSLEGISRYGAVLLENVPGERLGTATMEALAGTITERGVGLMMTGGRKSYAPGGYFRSPLEKVLPVSMELKQEHRKLSVAIVVALDRSGSMAVEIGGGKKKIDLADLGTVQVLDLLSPIDEFGVLAVDSASHVIVPLGKADRAARDPILRIDSMGGGIFIYEALSKASEMLLPAKAEAKHVLLFADAADSEEPGDYVRLLARCRDAGITVSVVGLGTPMDSDANLLRDIAARGGGTIAFSDRPEELPALFAQDTFVVARSSFIEDETPWKTTGSVVSLAGKTFGKPAALGGYNLTYLRAGANLAGVTEDEYQAPVVAAWQAGAGRVVAFTGEADGAASGPLAGWKDVSELYASLARWALGDARDASDRFLVTQSVGDGAAKVELHVDAQRMPADFPSPPVVTTLHGHAGEKPAVDRRPLEWTAPDTLTAVLPLVGSETALPSVEVPGSGRFALPPMCLPYSPEYRPATGRDSATLQGLARATGGAERVEVSGTWRDLPRDDRRFDLAAPLLVLAMVLLLLEVLERRTGLLTALLGARGAIERPRFEKAPEGAPVFARRQELPAEKPESREAEAPPPAPAMLDALKRAQERARDRTERDD